MPPLYVAIHLPLCAACLLAALRMPGRSRLAWGVWTPALVAIVGGIVVERRSDWAWSRMLLPWKDLVFFTNLSLEGVALLLGALWRQSETPGAKWRAAALTVPALGAALWSYAWFFAPLPAGLHGVTDARGFCAQTSNDSCNAAAAVMLLNGHGIRATEAEMARLCLTRQGHGTPPLGLYRGVSIRAAQAGFRPRLFVLPKWSRLGALPAPSVLSIGLKGGTPAALAEELEGYGWTPGQHHAVVLAVDPAGQWLDVADPSFGRERWPTKHIEHLWDGLALTLDRR